MPVYAGGPDVIRRITGLAVHRGVMGCFERRPVPDAATVLDGVPNLKTITLAPGRIVLGLDDLARDTPAVLQALAARGVAVRHISSGRANLEDVFLALTGRQLRD